MKKFNIFNKKLEEPYGATANAFDLEIPEGVKTNLILLVMRAKQNGATRAILADYLNQLADTITVSIGTKTVQTFDPVEYYEYVIRKLKELDINGLAITDDGTGADNQETEFVFPIILAPLDKVASKNDLINKDYGFNGAKKVSVLIDYPADANELDNRKITAYAVSIDAGNPSKVMMYETNSITFGSTGDKQSIGLQQEPVLKLYDVVFKLASYFSESLTDFLPTISKLYYRVGNVVKHIDAMRISHLQGMFMASESETTGVRKFDDQYVIVPFHEERDAETSLKLEKGSDLAVEVLVAETLIWTQLLIADLSYF